MKLVLLAALLGAAPTLPCPAQDFRIASSSKRPPTLVPPPGSGSYFGGSDDCAQPHANLGTGPLASMPFTTGTTGSEGQNETGCHTFPPPGTHLDVWYDWTSDRDGRASWLTCGGTMLDTRLVVWPFGGSSSCPVDGTSLACNDDGCNGSSVSWDVTAGTTYTLQLGVDPGEQGGGGTFDITLFEGGPCGQYDDGITETALTCDCGSAVNEIGWLHMYDCLSSIDEVQTAYGTALYPGSVTNGFASRIAVYDDLDDDGDPRTGLLLLEVVPTLIVNGDTDILNRVPLAGAPLPVSGGMCILATANYHYPGEFPAPMDSGNPVPQAWVVANTGWGSIDLVDLNNNDVPATSAASIGYPTAWLLRAVGAEDSPGAAFCFGDGSGAACPCANEGANGEGCANSSGSGGLLSSSGSDSASDDHLRLSAAQLLALQPALLFAGHSAVAGGQGIPFGDGLRCAGSNVVRLGVAIPDANGEASWGPGLGALGGWSAGDTRFFQAWFRDPGGPCGASFNLTNGIEVLFTP